MSLINQALRKVQSERSANKSTLGSGSPGAPYAYQRNNTTGILIGLSICIIVLIGLIAGLTFILLFKSSEPTIAQVSTSEAQTAPDATIDLSSDPEIKPLPTSLSPTAQTTTSNNQEKPTQTTPGTNESEAPAAKPNQEIIQWLSQSSVSGIRITEKSSKVILNNKAFTVGEIVNFNFDLELSHIEENKILFVDRNGVEYTKGL